jgi:hypothetical protein
LGLEFCDVSALQAQDKITGQSRQILFEGLPPQTQDLHGFFRQKDTDPDTEVSRAFLEVIRILRPYFEPLYSMLS